MNNFEWRGRRVFITGHTGFKGSWLALWLADLGADVTGFALAPPTTPSLFAQARVADLITHVDGDVRDLEALSSAMSAARPEVVFHLAAQSLVRYSYDHPVETYATNVMGTVHLLEAVRRIGEIRAVVCVTSDKCYENREWVWPYRESDAMGGHDPYSSSKGAAELAVSAYRRSYPPLAGTIASVRAGNVIGGGDWARDRLIPDIVRAMEAGDRPQIRSPNSVRPWQHVLEALGGYLMIAQRLFGGDSSAATAWNFGPSDDDTQPVGWMVEQMLEAWGAEGWDRPHTPQPHEAALLKLDCSKARAQLGWRPAMPLSTALRQIVDWHRAVSAGGDARTICQSQLHTYRAALRAIVPEFSA
ncbi:MAG: CDP-glucose 4,6-dehydratase [Sphingomonas bacterium]